MRRVIILAAAALIVLALVPMSSAATTSTTTKHVDGTVKVLEPSRFGVPYDRYWLARFEARTTLDGTTVQFGYLHLYGITNDKPTGNNAGAIHEFSIKSVTYFKTPTGPGATLHMEECIIVGAESVARQLLRQRLPGLGRFSGHLQSRGSDGQRGLDRRLGQHLDLHDERPELAVAHSATTRRRGRCPTPAPVARPTSPGASPCRA